MVVYTAYLHLFMNCQTIRIKFSFSVNSVDDKDVICMSDKKSERYSTTIILVQFRMDLYIEPCDRREESL